jgi:hypothetical protein
MSQEGIIRNIIGANKTLFTLRLPAQPQVGREPIKPSEVQVLVFSEGHESYRGVKNAFDLLDVLYGRGVTDPGVLALILEATGHPRSTEPAPQTPSVDTPSATEEDTRGRS